MLTRHNSRRTTPSAMSTFPFSAIVGQEEMKLALLLNAIDPTIGGALFGNRALPCGVRQQAISRGLARLGEELRRLDVLTIVVDTQNAFASSGEARTLAGTPGFEHVTLPVNRGLIERTTNVALGHGGRW